MIVTVKDAQSDLTKLVDRAVNGEEVVIADDCKPAVRRVPVEAEAPAGKRPTFGHWAAKMPPMDLERFRPRTDEELREEGFDLCLPDDK
jgi:antitoxin (DNA-binding transcriptional repressor) of toxin-antitoxin stability system